MNSKQRRAQRRHAKGSEFAGLFGPNDPFAPLIAMTDDITKQAAAQAKAAPPVVGHKYAIRMLADQPLRKKTSASLNKTPDLQSPSGNYYVVFQSDGNFVIYTSAWQSVWSTGTSGSAANIAKIQTDNNFVIGVDMAIGGVIAPIWQTKTAMTQEEIVSSGTAYKTTLDLLDNGDLQLLVGKELLWSRYGGFKGYDRTVLDQVNAITATAKAAEAAYNAKWEKDHESWLEGAVASAGHAIGDAIHAVADVSSSIADIAGSIPIIGPGLKGLYGYTYGALIGTIDNVAQGVRIDKVISRHFESQIQNVKEVAPYVQTVIAVVPGIGPGISGAISAGLSLASGKSIDQALLDGAIGSIPGGALGQAAVKIGIAAAQGKNIADATIDSLPIPPQAQQAAKAAMHVISDIAQGKPVTQALLNEADKQLDMLPPEFKKAAQVGIALGQGQRLQDIAKREVPNLVAPGGQLEAIGKNLAASDPIVNQARVLAGSASRGFDVGAGFMQHVATATDIVAARNALSPNDQKGFDMAVALHSARVVTPPTVAVAATAPAAMQAAGHYIVQGVAGASPDNKTAIVQTLVANPQAKAGAANGIAQVQAAQAAQVKKGFWQSIKAFLFGSP